MSTTLPELPEPNVSYADHSYPAYNAKAMHVYGLAVWKAAIEQASEACERLADSARRSNPSYCPDGDEYAAVVQHLPLPELAGSPQERRE